MTDKLSTAEREAAKQASFTAALLRQHRAVGKLLEGATMVGHGAWHFEETTFGSVIAAHEAANKEPLMPKKKPAG